MAALIPDERPGEIFFFPKAAGHRWTAAATYKLMNFCFIFGDHECHLSYRKLHLMFYSMDYFFKEVFQHLFCRKEI